MSRRTSGLTAGQMQLDDTQLSRFTKDPTPRVCVELLTVSSELEWVAAIRALKGAPIGELCQERQRSRRGRRRHEAVPFLLIDRGTRGQFRQLQFHCGNPPPAAEPSTRCCSSNSMCSGRCSTACGWRTSQTNRPTTTSRRDAVQLMCPSSVALNGHIKPTRASQVTALQHGSPVSRSKYVRRT